jgi:hypothetical protein
MLLQNSGTLMRPRGAADAADHAGIFSVDDLLAHAQFLDILLVDEVLPASALAGLPEPQAAAMLGVNSPWGSLANHYHFSTTLVAMLAHERLGNTHSALACASILLEADLTMGGTRSALRHSFAHASRGRVLASEGRVGEAETAFTGAVEMAEGCGSHFFAALALRDLCNHVLDGASQGQEGRRRLEEVASQLACSVDDLDGIVYP